MTKTVQRIPLSDEAKQSMTVVLAGVSYDLSILYNDLSSRWTLNLVLTETGEELVSGQPLVLGVDLLAGSALGIGELWVTEKASTGADPSEDSLDSSVWLDFIPAEEDA